MTLLVSELRLRRFSLMVWAGSVAALVLLVVAFYPQVRDNPSMNSLYADMSPSMQALLGGSDLISPVGFLNTQLFAFFLPAVLIIFGVGRGAASLAGEEEERTLDLLLSQPVPRWSVYLQKAAAVTAGLLILTVAAWIPLAALNAQVQFDLPAVNLAAVCTQLALFTLALSLAAQAIAAATGRRAVGVGVVAGYAFVSYVVYGLSATVSGLKSLRPLTIWRWYVLDDPLSNGFDWTDIAVLVVGSLIAVAAGAYMFNRRDLRS